MNGSEPLAPNLFADRIVAGDPAAVDHDSLVRMFAGEGDTSELMAAADRVRRHYFGDEVHLCSIVNAKMGGCPEDCGFCSQSRHFSTHVQADRFISNDEMVEASAKARSQHATALGLVTATRGFEDGSKALGIMLDGVRAVREAGHTEAHASLGFVSEHGLAQLKAAGLTEINHNLETGRGFFEDIVSSHTYDERIETIRAAKRVGLRTCAGGIVGMGEKPVHRAELALTLRELDVDEVPINFLVSIEGTRLEKIEPMTPLEMLRAIACFRLALPRQNIFVAAGRQHLGQLQPLIFGAGASGMMIGDFLTTANRSVADDLEMIEQLGLRTHVCGDVRPEMQRHEAAATAKRKLPVVA